MNLLADLPQPGRDEAQELVLGTREIRIERIVSFGHVSPKGFWYDQKWDEWVLLLAGAARLEFENGPTIELHTGDTVQIAAHRRHRVEWTQPDTATIWLAVHYRGEQLPYSEPDR